MTTGSLSTKNAATPVCAMIYSKGICGPALQIRIIKKYGYITNVFFCIGSNDIQLFFIPLIAIYYLIFFILSFTLSYPNRQQFFRKKMPPQKILP
jgi:hypothetical protein